jgi:hypothetical protein
MNPPTIRFTSRFLLSCVLAAFRHGDFLPGDSGASKASERSKPADQTAKSIAGSISGIGA